MLRKILKAIIDKFETPSKFSQNPFLVKEVDIQVI
jgi:hypothetical protein